MPTISDQTLQAIRDRADIKIAIQSCGIPLVRRGYLWICCCPFHSEQTPSFKVDVRRQTFRCYGGSCGKSGDVFQFFIEYERLTFPEAVKRVADLFNLGHLLNS